MIVLRPYQETTVEAVRRSYRAGRRAPLVVIPTGGGKTVIFTHIAATSSQRAKRVLILVHRVELLRQTSAALRKAGVMHGLINPLYTPNPLAQVQVASVQTIIKRLDKIALDFDLVIIDEAHHATAGSWLKVIEAVKLANPNMRILGVTATPCRTDGKGLGVEAGGVFDEIVEGPSVAELIGMGFLVRPVIYAPEKSPDFSHIHVVGGDYNRHELEVEMDKPMITGDAVAHYARICPGAPAVVFCVSVKHAEHVASEFRAAGYRAESVDGSMYDDERSRILGGLADGSVQVVCSCDLISEGTDIPAIGCAILLRPTKSLSLYLQQVGRALRPCDGKDRAIILDHVGNVMTHGLPDEPREWSLTGTLKLSRQNKKQNEPVIRVSQCMQCFAMVSKAPTCPECGFLFPVEKRELSVVDGELQEITEDKRAELLARRAKRREVGMAKTLEELKEIAKARGYNPRWAEHVFKARQNKAS